EAEPLSGLSASGIYAAPSSANAAKPSTVRACKLRLLCCRPSPPSLRPLLFHSLPIAMRLAVNCKAVVLVFSPDCDLQGSLKGKISGDSLGEFIEIVLIVCIYHIWNHFNRKLLYLYWNMLRTEMWKLFSMDLANFKMVQDFRKPLLYVLEIGLVDLCFANEDKARVFLKALRMQSHPTHRVLV
ncbi:hypothetical protein Taro_036606, partial [Colocasia esculenta]|nr:hypothetical protein [Colocasia esculenta]